MEHYTYGGQVDVWDFFLDNAMDGGGKKTPTFFSEKYISTEFGEFVLCYQSYYLQK